MNLTRLLRAILVAFVFIFVTDFLIHAIWLKPDDEATSHLWRTEAEMGARFPWMLLAQLLAAVTFVLLWVLGFAGRGTFALACVYGFLIGLAVQVATIITFVVSPFPAALALKWIGSGLLQAVVLGVITFRVYRPSSRKTRA